MRTSTDITPDEWRSAPKMSLENHIGSVQIPRKSDREPMHLKQVVYHFFGSDNSKHHKVASINAEKVFDALVQESEEKVFRTFHVIFVFSMRSQGGS